MSAGALARRGRARARRSAAFGAAALVLALARPSAPAAPERLVVSTFNVHCPAYRRMPAGTLEAAAPDVWLERNRRILQLPIFRESDFIALQEIWYAEPELTSLYINALLPKYQLHGLQRGHGRRGRVREDGLLTAVSRDWSVLAEIELDFADVADRCAQLLHLRRAGRQVLLVNTHLLYPHNAASSAIRVREVHKILAAVEEYKASLRRPRKPLPVLLCGDLNGSPRGDVARCLRRYGFASSFDEVHGVSHGPKGSGFSVYTAAGAGAGAEAEVGAGAEEGALAARRRAGAERGAARAAAEAAAPAEAAAADTAADAAASADGGAGAGADERFRLVTHRTHTGKLLACDYILALNPSGHHRRPRGWSDMVFAELWLRLCARGCDSAEAGFAALQEIAAQPGQGQQRRQGAEAEAAAAAAADEDEDEEGGVPGALTADGFKRALRALGFSDESNPASPALTDSEVSALVAVADENHDGRMDAGEWAQRFELAVDALRVEGEGPAGPGSGIASEAPDASHDLVALECSVHPPCLLEGRWPGDAPGEEEAWVSDHGALTARFGWCTAPAYEAEEGGAEAEAAAAAVAVEGGLLSTPGAVAADAAQSAARAPAPAAPAPAAAAPLAADVGHSGAAGGEGGAAEPEGGGFAPAGGAHAAAERQPGPAADRPDSDGSAGTADGR